MSLQISNLQVSIRNKKILKGVDLTINPGEIHALMGPNGSGKSTLALTLMGHSKFKICPAPSESLREKRTGIKLDGKDIIKLSPDERAELGLFLAFQYPYEVSGISVSNFLRHAKNSLTGKSLPILEFKKELKERAKLLELSDKFLSRPLNEGFSGGEKKKSEILQMSVLKPKYAILDEPDSGLDIDSVETIAKAIKKIVNDQKMGILLITHYPRILKYIKPHFVHIMIGGKIIKSGGPDLAGSLEEYGYKSIENNNG